MAERTAYWDVVSFLRSGHLMLGGEEKRQEKIDTAIDAAVMDIAATGGIDMDAVRSCIRAQYSNEAFAAVNMGLRFGIEATPTMIINGEIVHGAIVREEFESIVDRAIRSAKSR